MKKFSEVVSVRKVNSCPTCNTYKYVLPCVLSKEVESFLSPLGKLKYSLKQLNIIELENDLIRVSRARVGSNSLNVKYKKNTDRMRPLVETHIAAFIESEMNILIEMGEYDEE